MGLKDIRPFLFRLQLDLKYHKNWQGNRSCKEISKRGEKLDNKTNFNQTKQITTLISSSLQKKSKEIYVWVFTWGLLQYIDRANGFLKIYDANFQFW